MGGLRKCYGMPKKVCGDVEGVRWDGCVVGEGVGEEMGMWKEDVGVQTGIRASGCQSAPPARPRRGRAAGVLHAVEWSLRVHGMEWGVKSWNEESW
jgi:hypothetical protein